METILQVGSGADVDFIILLRIEDVNREHDKENKKSHLKVAF